MVRMFHRKNRQSIAGFLSMLLGFTAWTWIWHSLDPGDPIQFDHCKDESINYNTLQDVKSDHDHQKMRGPNSKPSKNNLIFVGVMTANKYLDTRAVAVYNTWGRKVPGDMAFFASETSDSSSEIPVVPLRGVDDVYPPQKKSFLMLKYMHDHYLEDFEWFMRADDDLYIRTDLLHTFLKTLDSSRVQFIGQAGLGNKEEFGLLNFNDHDNFCMGGPGMIFSRNTLRKVVPHISHCLRNLYSTHEDVEVGRCITRFTNITCTWAYEVSKTIQDIVY